MEVRVLKDQKIRKQCIQFYWSFQRDGGCYKKIPSVREVHVWIFYVATHFPLNLESHQEELALTKTACCKPTTNFSSIPFFFG